MFRNLFKQKELKNNTGINHDDFFNSLREKEYHRLTANQQVYLDYTGGNLYSDSQLSLHSKILTQNVFGNPHSTNPTSQLTTQLVEEARSKVLDFFNAQDYYCIFTQNASSALKIVGECYPFDSDSHFLLLSDNHNSVNGIREYCKSKGGEYTYVSVQYEDLQIDSNDLNTHLNHFQDKKNKLFAYPAQSNVSGVKHSLEWIEKAQSKGWDVLLDAAAFVPTSELNLSIVKPDFVSISFYKIFGYPTGIGCLLIKKSKFNKLKKPWFAGGTVTLAGVISPSHYLADNHEKFENGTINYLDIPALKIGLDYIESIGMKRINERVTSLINYLYSGLVGLKHNNAEKQLNIFGPKDRENVGGTIIMTFLNPDNTPVPFEAVEQMANNKMISIRSGCFCNPGIDEINNCLSTEELSGYFTSRDKGNYYDMITFLNKMRGATRVSVGIATTKKDLDTFIGFVKELSNQTIDNKAYEQ
ncbi:MAG: aminotransferase class V-fold PLP-dependent enzyme [Crocinitomicaceae bacterium]